MGYRMGKIKEVSPEDLKRMITMKRNKAAPLCNENIVESLFDLARDYYDSTSKIIEVGCECGISTEAWLLCIDHVDAVDSIQQKEMYALIVKYPRSLTYYTGDSGIVSKYFKANEYDGVYIDADHSYPKCKMDIEAYLPKIKKGGIMSGHDYCAGFGVIQAVTECFGKPDRIYPDNSWVKQV